MSRWLALLTALVLGGSPAAAQTPPTVEALLAADPTPGTTALLVEHATRADVQAHLVRQLAHPGTEVRAAAARVILAMGIRGLVPQLASTLQAEGSGDTAAELTRAVVILGGPEQDEMVVASWARLGPDAAPAAIAFARVRGPAALGALPRLAAVPPRAIGAFVEAARPDAATIDRLLDQAAAGGDLAVFRAALSAARLQRYPPADARLIAALAADRPPEMRLEAARAALAAWTGEAPLAAAVVAALTLAAPLGAEAADVDAAVVRELTARLSGRREPPGDVWRAQIEEPGVLLASLLASSKGVQALLTSQEMRRVRRALPHLGRPFRPDAVPPLPGRLAVQLLDSYPRGFVPAVIAATGCELAKARGQGIGAGAGELVLRRDGRSASIAPFDTGVSQAACGHATRVLLMTHVTDTPPAADNERRIAVVPFDDEYLRCRESETDDFSGGVNTGAARVTPPKKTRHVNPIYPVTAQRSGVQGDVVLEATIGAGGCVGRLHVIRGVDPRLDLAALLAVMRWRFSPTLVDGRPMTVIMTATVQFSLR